jgi:hypothetical protein
VRLAQAHGSHKAGKQIKILNDLSLYVLASFACLQELYPECLNHHASMADADRLEAGKE